MLYYCPAPLLLIYEKFFLNLVCIRLLFEQKTTRDPNSCYYQSNMLLEKEMINKTVEKIKYYFYPMIKAMNFDSRNPLKYKVFLKKEI